jgi:heme a synthase
MDISKTLSRFRRISLLTIYSVLFLIWVGGWVRSTGSGMGCPDWPKCFGVWIPPTSIGELPPNYEDHFLELRKKKNERLVKMLNRMGMTDLAQTIQNDPDINTPESFNVYKTWTEYINRLIGVLVGFFILLTVWASFPLRKTHRSIFWLSIAGLIGVLFEGWLGSIVVSTNLLPALITIHMFIAMLILVVLIIAYMRAREVATIVLVPKKVAWVGVGVSILALMQVMFGTQVRESVDVTAKIMGAEARAAWIENLGFTYLLHIRFYWVLITALAVWLYQLKPFIDVTLKRWIIILLVMLGSEIVMGISMHYFAIPPLLQPMHLLFGTSIFTLCYFITASLFNGGKSVN